jgi:hypothetical protein
VVEQYAKRLKFPLSSGANDLIRVARDAAARVPSEPFSPPYKFRHSSLTGVVFAALSVEGFLNELPELDWMTEGQPSLAALNKQVQTMRRMLAYAEEANSPTAMKLLLMHEALGQPLDCGAAAFQDFYLLKQLRDAIVHPKSSNITVSFDPVEFRSSHAKLLRALQSRGLLFEDPTKQGLPFFVWLSGDAVAAWAVKVASSTVIATLEALPAGDFRLGASAYFLEFLDDEKKRTLLGLANQVDDA